MKTVEDSVDTHSLPVYAPRKQLSSDLLADDPHPPSGLPNFKKLQKHRSNTYSSSSPPPYPMISPPTFLKKPARTRSQAKYISSATFSKSKREGVKFRPDDVDLSSDEDNNGGASSILPIPQRQNSQSTLVTLVERDQNKLDARSGGEQGVCKHYRKNQALEYSDIEEDITLMPRNVHSQDTSTWVPRFLRKTSELTPLSDPSVTSSASQQKSWLASPSALEIMASQPASSEGVPLTPSLIHALGRITAAQRTVYGSETRPTLVSLSRDGDVSDIQSSRTNDEEEGQDHPVEQRGDWRAFWKDVKNNVKV
jgi:hypothetical protein